MRGAHDAVKRLDAANADRRENALVEAHATDRSLDVMPPSTVTTVPLVKLERGEAR